MTKIIFIGQAPNSKSEDAIRDRPTLALTGACGRKLAELSGLTFKTWLKKTERLNLLQKFPGKNKKGDKFPPALAKRAALDVVFSGRLNFRKVVLLGNGVAKAMLGGKLEPFVWFPVLVDSSIYFQAALVPHPSGINRFWNSPQNAAKGRAFLSEAFR